MQIEYYSNGCGRGKTYAIKNIIKANPTAYFLVVVPSVALAQEYSDVGTPIIGVKTSDGKDEILPNVQKRITYSLIWDDVRVLVVTQKAFMDSTDKLRLCRNRIVIQDEALTIFNPSKWKMNNHKEWLNMFDIKAYNEHWFKTDLNEPIAKALLEARDSLDELTAVQDLLASPYDIWANNNNFDDHTQMFTVLKPEVYKHALKVIIACANFEQSFQFQIWQNLYKVKFVCQEQFEPYDGSKATIHYATQKVNSITFNKNDDSIRNKVIEYIKDSAKSEAVVVADNNYFAVPEGWARVKLNCHGLNKHENAKHIAILSALNYENVTVAFLNDVCGMVKESVRYAYLGETAHQIAMRGVLRQHEKSDEHCHIYLMEKELAFYMNWKMFDSKATFCPIPDTDRPGTVSAAEKKECISQVDRNKANYIRKEWAKFKDMSSEDIRNHVTWGLLNSRGKVNALARELFTEKELKSALEL